MIKSETFMVCQKHRFTLKKGQKTQNFEFLLLDNGSLMVHSWFIHGSTMVQSRFIYGSFMVHLWFIYGSFMVQPWFIYGSFMVQSWFNHGSFKILIKLTCSSISWFNQLARGYVKFIK